MRETALDDLSTRAVGREAEWCANVPALLQNDEWNVPNTYAAELALVREFVTLTTDAQPRAVLPQAQALAPVTSPSYTEVIAAGMKQKYHAQDNRE